MAESATRNADRTERGDARFRHASLLFDVRRASWLCALLLLLSPLATAQAQGPPPRPWLDWHTTQTEHFVFHYPSAYREWTFALADRIEALRSDVATIVGFAPSRRVHILVDDPLNDANGYAFTPLDEQEKRELARLCRKLDRAA